MSIKWADYLISKVRYDKNNNYITNLFIHTDNGSDVGAGESYSRQAVINGILEGTSFNTIYFKNGKWNNGARVQIVTISNVNYLRTDSNKVSEDNLGQLPRY